MNKFDNCYETFVVIAYISLMFFVTVAFLLSIFKYILAN